MRADFDRGRRILKNRPVKCKAYGAVSARKHAAA